MHLNGAEVPHGIMEKLRAELDAMPADDPRKYLRQCLQLLASLLEQRHQRWQALEVRMEALEFGSRRPGEWPPPPLSAGA
jgi:hypothetical protein